VSLRHFVYALVAAVLAYLVRELRRRRLRVNPRRPELTMEEAVELWRRSDRADPDSALVPESLSGAPDGAVLEAVAQAGREAEQQSLRAASPRQAIREAILAQATLALKLEAILGRDERARAALVVGYQPGMQELLGEGARVCHQSWRLLRFYARLKFDDAAPEDWFHRYVRLARPYIREKVRLAEAAVVEMDEGARRFAELYDLLLADLKKEALAAPPKKRFPPPDLPQA
jgi:hypothetical protein